MFFGKISLLSHIVHHLEGRKGIAKELVMDEKKRLKLWQDFLSSYAEKEELSRKFNYKNVDEAVMNFEATKEVLERIESLIVPELVTIEDEEKLDEEIIADLEILIDDGAAQQLAQALVDNRGRHKTILTLFQKIHDALKAELNLIRLIKKYPEKRRDLLIRLFRLIYFTEEWLSKPFKEEFFPPDKKTTHTQISDLAQAVLLQEKLKEDIETAEEKIAEKMLGKMVPYEEKGSRKEYRELGEDILLKLAEKCGASTAQDGEAFVNAIDKMDSVMYDDAQMYKVIKEVKPKFDDTKIKAVIIAFRKAHVREYFEDVITDLNKQIK